MLTAGLTGIAFVTDTYIGSPYGSMFAHLPFDSFDEFPSVLLALAVMFLPGAFFGFIAVWPLTIVAANWALKFELSHPDWQRAHWPLTGAALGGPALFLYSFPLGLGQNLIGQLLANGVLIGLICACLVRLFSRRYIINAAIGSNEE